MEHKAEFDIADFIPYLLNQAAEATSRDFETLYKKKYKMLRAEWRVLFHLGRYGELTAKDICARARMHKTKVSRAVHALEAKRMLTRTAVVEDRRHELLTLTPAGAKVFDDLYTEAARFNLDLLEGFSDMERGQLRSILNRLAQLPSDA